MIIRHGRKWDEINFQFYDFTDCFYRHNGVEKYTRLNFYADINTARLTIERYRQQDRNRPT